MTWPSNWDSLLTEGDCPMCREGRPEDTGHGIRVYSSDLVDAYLGRKAAQRGYVVVIWRGRHINDLTELTSEELATYWSEIARISTGFQEYYTPHKVNYEVLGNQVPHLHTHLTARYLDGDVAPGGPLPQQREAVFSDTVLREDASALRALLSPGAVE